MWVRSPALDHVLGSIMSGSEPALPQWVMATFLNMNKLDIAALESA
jgi:hypothetical protein